MSTRPSRHDPPAHPPRAASIALAVAVAGAALLAGALSRQPPLPPPAAEQAVASASTAPLAPREPLVIAPTVEGMPLCDEAAQDPKIVSIDDAYVYCRAHGLDGAAAVARLLDTLEPGGPEGQVRVGFTATLQLLGLYRRSPGGGGWQIDAARVDEFLRVIEKVQRPVVVYFSADHFDSIGPIVAELAKDPRNLMHYSDGSVPELGYFGYRIMPYTLLTDPRIPVNKYRFDALEYVAKRIAALPEAVRNRIVAFTLAGEVHQLFPDFESGMGRYDNIRVTDYSPESVAQFRRWLEKRYGTLAAFNASSGFSYPSFDAVPAPSKDIRTQPLNSFGEHYDAFADGTLPFSGWLWDPQRQVDRLDLYVDAQRVAEVPRGLNRLDVYRAVEAIDTPNVGYRIDYDFSALAPGRHVAQIVALHRGARLELARAGFVVVPRDQSPLPDGKPAELNGLKKADAALAGVRSWLDLPKAGQQDVYYNPLARDWNAFRAEQVKAFLAAFHDVALHAGLPADKLYSHQIVPSVNSTWNPRLFAVGPTLERGVPWKTGLNMYGGAADSDWMRQFMAERAMHDYGIPEFNPQQWKRDGVALRALRAHYDAGARFVSPYYFSVIPDRFKNTAAHGVNSMELGPANPRDGSDRFYRAIQAFAKH